MGKGSRNKLSLSLLKELNVLLAIILFVEVPFCFGNDGGEKSGQYSGEEETMLHCIKSPETVMIECRVLNTKRAECIDKGKNIISVPITLENENAEINCTSKSPIDMSFVGFQLDDYTNTTFVRNAENVFNEGTFVFSISLQLSRVKASREVVVSKFINPEQKVTFFLFRPEAQIFSSNLQPKKSVDQTDNSIILEHTEKNMIIPCIPNYANITPVLEEVLTDVGAFLNKRHVQIQSFDKTKGFVLKTDVNGSYINPSGRYRCKAKKGEGESEESVLFHVKPRQDQLFQPNLDKVYLFGKSKLRVSCQYGDRVFLSGTFKNANIVPKPFVSDTSWLSFGSEYEDNHVKVGDRGKIECKTTSEERILKTWDIETLDIRNNSILQMRKLSENKITCQSSTYSTDEMKLQVVFCQGETECKLNEFCFDETEESKACTKTLTGIPCNENGGRNSLCLELPQNDPWSSQGMVRCSGGNYSYLSKYIIGFDKILYLNWEDAPYSAMISIFVPNVTMYPQNSYPFGCKATKFISDGKIGWVIRGKDGSEILLHKNRVQDIHGTYASALDYELYTVRESNIRLIYPNDYDIICMVPQWNATPFLRHYERINVAAKVAPVAEIVSAAMVVIVLLLCVVVYVMWRLKKAKDAIRNLTEKEVQEFLEGNPEALKNASEKETHEVIDSLPYDKTFEIPRDKLLIDTENILGKGAFGTVLKGRVEGVSTVVAVKTVNSDCEVSRFKGFLSELKIMIYIGKHPNIVSLIGASTEKIQEKTLYIIVEFCPNGSLESFLRRYKGSFVDQVVNNEIRPGLSPYQNVSGDEASPSVSSEGMMTTLDLIKWSYQIALGMEYLATKKVVHADLAARNVLVDSNGCCKITDFGLSRQLFDYTQYVKKQQEPLPWRWMAIESLQELRFSSQSDVWAFGILLWEIFSLGDVPYPGLSWDIHFVQQLCNGLRLNKPSRCIERIYNLMIDCWQQRPEDRPEFSFITQFFKSLLQTLDVDVDAINEATFTEEGSIFSNHVTTLVPGYMSVGALVDVDIGSDRKSTNIYINS